MWRVLTRGLGLPIAMVLATSAVAIVPAAATSAAPSSRSSVQAGPSGTPGVGVAPAFGKAAIGPSAGAGFSSGAPGVCQATPPCGALTYHNGWVMHTTHTYAIYWQPSNVTATAMSSGYESTINQYLTDLGNTSAYDLVTQYSDGTTGHLVNNSAFSGSVVATNPTASGATGTTASPIQDTDVIAEVQAVLTAQGWTTNLYNGEQNVFAVFLPQNVDECSGSACRSNAYCAYHSWYSDSVANHFGVYAVMPYDDSAAFTQAGCTSNLATHTSTTPNGLAVDSEISTLSHELFEAATNPLPGATCGALACDGWYYQDGAHEIGDQCNFYFGALAVDGGNETLHGHRYLAQQEWSNADSGCVQTYPDHLSVTPVSGTVTAGASFGVSATAVDSNLGTATGYIGRVQLTSTDPAAALPGVYTYTAADAGAHGFTVTLNTAGTQTVTATDVDTGSIVGSATRSVASDTTTNLVSSLNPSNGGQGVTFTATVAGTALGAGTPTGQAQFSVDGSAFGSPVALTGGVATLANVTALVPGTHAVTANYLGATGFNASASNQVNQTVNGFATTTTVSSPANPSVFGQPVTFTAIVVSGGHGTATGTAQFFVDGSPQGGPVTLAGGSASLAAISNLAVANHSVSATYSGGGSLAGSSGPLPGGQTVNAAHTTTGLTAGLSPSVFGQPVTFTVTVSASAPGSGTPTGQVQFFIDGSASGSPVTLAGGSGTSAAVSNLAVGTHAVTATYAGSSNFLASLGTLAGGQVVNRAAGTTTVTSGANPSVSGQGVAFTAHVAALAPGSGTPSGNVSFFVDGSFLETDALSGGTASTSPDSGLSTATHSVTATYLGDGNFSSSAGSLAGGQTVRASNSATAVVSARTPTVFGQAVTFTATVTPVAPGTGTPTGQVQFFIDGATSGTPVGLSSGVASSAAVGNLSVGSHLVTATYAGDADFNPSASTSIAQVVNKAGTATSVAVAPNPSVFGQSVGFSATVTATAPGAGTPGGSVQFLADGNPVGGAVSLVNGVATTSDAALPAGSHTITANYLGDASFTVSSNATGAQVNPSNTTTSLVSSADPSVFGQPVTVTATVSPTAPGAGTPTGQVQLFVDGSASGGPVTLSGGAATLAAGGNLSTGGHAVTATYAGSANFSGSLGTLGGGQTVNPAASATTITSSPNPSVYGQGVTFTAHVAAVAPGAGTPTGNVTFFVDGSLFETDPLTAGATSSSMDTSLATGNHAVTATYGGDADFSTSGGSLGGGQTVNKDATSVALASSVNPSAPGQGVSFTATVTATAPGAGVPTGQVQFSLDGLPFGGPVSLSGGVATSAADSSLNPGSHPVVANYLGSGSFWASSSPTLTQVVGGGGSTTTVTSSSPTSVFGQPVTFTANVAAVPPAVGTPTGQVRFFADGTNWATATLSGGVAVSAPLTTLAVGSHTVSATYGGDVSFNPGSGSTTQVVGQASVTVSVTTSPNPSVFGEGVGLTATVIALSPGGGTPTGQVQFTVDGANAGAPVAVVNGVATTSTVALAPGIRVIGANYQGDTNFLAASNASSQHVSPASSATGLASSANPSALGQPVSFTATVAAVSPGAGTPTGQVQFFIDGSSFGSAVTLSGGRASSPAIASLQTTTHPVTATYSGDADFNGGTSPTLDQVVGQSDATETVASTVNPSVFGQGVQFTATVAGAFGTPTGTVQFGVDGVNLGTAVTLAGGVATSTVDSALAACTHTVTATYRGNLNYRSAGSGTTQTVSAAATTAGLASSLDPSTFGQPVTFTATVGAVPPGAGTPTGQVQFVIDGGAPITATLAAGTASSSLSTLGAGNHSVLARYLGDADFTTSTATLGGGQTVNRAGSSVAVTSSANPSVWGQAVQFTATASPVAPGGGTPNGTVQFLVDGSAFGPAVALSGGSASSASTTTLAPGNHTVTASYGGSADFTTSTATLGGGQTVNRAASSVAVTSSANPSSWGQAVQFTATASAVAPGGGTPDGTVQFLVDGSAFGPAVALSGGSASSASTTTLAPGNHTVTVSYGGSADFTTSTATLGGGQTVNRAGSSVAVSSSRNPSTAGDTVVFTATVVVAPGAGTAADGAGVQFVIDGASTGSPVALSGGVATYSTSSLGAGTHTVSAVYAGDADVQGSQGSLPGGQVVNATGRADLAVQAYGPGRAVLGLGVTFVVVVTDNGQSAGTGVVVVDQLPSDWSLSGVSTTQGTCASSGPTVTCTIGNLAVAAQAVVVLQVVPHATGSFTNQASVSGDLADPNPANNASSVRTIVRRFGYWLFGADGGVFTFGDAQFFGSTGSMHINRPVVAMTSTPSGQGYWLFGSDGGVYAYGDAGFFGSTGAMHLNAPIVAMATTPDGQGYWLFGADGGVFAFGDARFLGSTGGSRVSAPIVGMAATNDGQGYWLVGADGAVYPFGDATAFGNLTGQHLNAPVVAMAATPSGQGYWLVASDGGVFPFGDAGNFGSLGGSHLNSPIVGVAATPDGLGYWLVAADGGVFGYGDAPFLGGMGGQHLNKGILGLASNG